VHGSMAVTEDVADRLLRLPLWPDMASDVDRVCAAVIEVMKRRW
jgi:dTDP-4-amino-4,6-dideoxygalactose transaminase